MSLVNNEMYTTLKSAFEQATGMKDIEITNLHDIIDTANDPNVVLEKDIFVKSLAQLIYKNLYTDTEFKRDDNDVFFENSSAYGAIIQTISVEVPEVNENPAWTAITSGQTTIGSNTVFVPVVNTQYYGKTDTWSIPVVFSDVQLNSAFLSENALGEFYSYINLSVRNSVKKHRQVMSGLNRNNYMAEKIAYSKKANAKGVHVINLVKKFCEKTGLTEMTVTEFRKNADALRFAIQEMKLFKNYMMDMSTLFNTAQHNKFIDSDRFVAQVLAEFESDIETNALSQTYHEEFITMPLHRTVPAWQGLTSTTALDFNTVSSIKIETASDGTEVSQSGIVALFVDKWAIMHTIVESYVGFQHDDIKRLNLYDYQFTDRYMNNLTLNGLVFILEDVSVV